jgi:hypothetical protein
MVGRPGLDPGTLGLKEGNEQSKPEMSVGIVKKKGKTRFLMFVRSGAVTVVRGMKRGIFEGQSHKHSLVVDFTASQRTPVEFTATPIDQCDSAPKSIDDTSNSKTHSDL